MKTETTAVRLSELLAKTNLAGKPKADPLISGLSYDSRTLKKGDLFFAIKGENFDGNKFINDVKEKGASAVITSEDISDVLPAVKVESVLGAMSKMSHVFFGKPSTRFPVIGVTGTNGKTTITYLIESIFNRIGKTCGVMGTINYRYQNTVFPAPNTTPMSLDIHQFINYLNTQKATALAMEVSSHALALGRVDDVSFVSGIFTNLTQDHLDFHKDMDSYFDAKAKLFRNGKSKKAAINIDDSYGQKLAKELGNGFFFGFDSKANVRAQNETCDLNGIQFDLFLPSGKTTKIKTNLIGRHNISNLLASAAGCLAFGLSEEDIIQGLNQNHAIPGRLERVEAGQDFVVVVDYAHTPDALSKALQALREVNPKKLICIFGAGGDRDRKKRPLMGKIAAQLADEVVLTSDNPRTEDPHAILKDIEVGVKEGGKKAFVSIENRAEAIKEGIGMAEKGDIVLIAGKGHEDYQIYGKKKIHFSDQETARQVLSSWN